MTQKDKELLLKDLCVRLPYGVICTDNRHGDSRVFNIDSEDGILYYTDFDECGLIENCKPYLRPMLSMTEEEKLHLELNYGFEIHGDVLSNLHIIKGGGYYEREGEYVEPTEYRQYTHITIDTVSELIKWLNAHHFDYRGLIEKGLALEAPDGMYK